MKSNALKNVFDPYIIILVTFKISITCLIIHLANDFLNVMRLYLYVK